MSGGSITGGNKSPKGAISTDADAVLAFSGNVIVSGNTDGDGVNAMNVYLGYDSNGIITTSGLSPAANIGVYVADGEPEEESVPDAVSNPIYCDHGLSARNFGTYTGSNINNANLGKFVSDRIEPDAEVALTGIGGAKIAESDNYYVAWNGKGLQINTFKLTVDETTTPASETTAPASGISIAFYHADGVQVWTGKSDADGFVAIPWGPEEKSGGNVAVFAPKGSYTLKQVAANEETVRPAGSWTMTVGRDNSVVWGVVGLGLEHVNRTIAIEPSQGKYLGATFNLYNDSHPTLTFDAMGGKLSGGAGSRAETVGFTTTEVNHAYSIKEANPTWDSHVFRGWATMETKPTGENGEELTEQELAERGYFEYRQNDNIVFFCGTDEDQGALGFANGNTKLYAQWDAVVCKITDRDGNLLYINGSPAVFGTLEEGFDVYNGRYSFTDRNGKAVSSSNVRRIEMLVGTYSLNSGLTLERGKTVLLTTAPSTDTDGYAYTGEKDSVCVITRGEGHAASMLTNKGNLTLSNIALDGANREVDCDGGIVNNMQDPTTTVRLTINGNTILRNSRVNGNGAGIFLAERTELRLSGSPVFENNISNVELPSEAKNGGADYTEAHQDIYIAGYAGSEDDTNAVSLIVENSISANAGSIWVWAAEAPHFKSLQQFARVVPIMRGAGIAEETCNVFRNARDDVSAENNTGEYRKGTLQSATSGYVESATSGYIYWSGVYDSNKVVLRKVDAGGEPLSDAVFTLYRSQNADSSPVRVNGQVLENLGSSEGGTIWVGELPYGDYYLYEKVAPSGYSAGKWFKLTVDDEVTCVPV